MKPPDEQDRAEWDREWANRPVRRLVGPVQIDLAPVFATWGTPIHVDIVAVPDKFIEMVIRETEACPVCGEPTSNGDRIAVSIYPEFANACSYGVGAWAHEACFAACEFLPGAKHIPW